MGVDGDMVNINKFLDFRITKGVPTLFLHQGPLRLAVPLFWVPKALTLCFLPGSLSELLLLPSCPQHTHPAIETPHLAIKKTPGST